MFCRVSWHCNVTNHDGCVWMTEDRSSICAVVCCNANATDLQHDYNKDGQWVRCQSDHSLFLPGAIKAK